MFSSIIHFIKNILTRDDTHKKYNYLFEKDPVWISYRKYKQYNDNKLFKLPNFISF